ncbi:MAG: hypothetical protein LQ350_001259 [Teloschistes chrysophthalmus]|nr:MAG: hypothetical protein LQ350_001259 [Niorma chrysophthalma]
MATMGLNTNDQQQSLFLQLPREIRDRIYEELLDVEFPIPDPIDSKEERLRLASRRGGSIRVVNHLPAISTGGLARCCHQIFDELSGTIERRSASARGITGKLDLMIHGPEERHRQERIFPSWTALPAPMSSIKIIHVTFRTIKPETLFWVGDGGPGFFTQALLHLLGCFFAYGPSFEDGKSQAPNWIEELRMDLETDDRALRGGGRRSVCGQLKRFLMTVSCSGVLGGRLGKLSLYVAGTLSDEWEVKKYEDNLSTVREWSQYGWIPL